MKRIPLTPLVDIAFLVLIFFMALPLRRLDGKLTAYLPREEGIREVDRQPPDTVRIRLRKRGEAVRYELGDHVADRPLGLAPVLRLLGPDNIYEIDGDPALDWQEMVGMVDLLQALHYDRVRFRGTALPDRPLRRQIPLPRPR